MFDRTPLHLIAFLFMSIIINYPSDSNINRVSYHLSEEKQAIAIDYLATIFQILSESSKRLESKIAAITLSQNLEGMPLIGSGELVMNVALLDYKREPEQVLVRTALAEAWAIIDYVHRAGEILPLAKVLISEADEELLRRIKLVRNSYHHNNDRLEEHFVTRGSVFGNLSWKFMDALNTTMVNLYPSISPSRTSSGNFQNSKTLPAITQGVSYVSLHFVAKERKQSPVVDEEISFESIAELINKIIGNMERTFQKIIDWADALQQEHPDSSIDLRMPPLIMLVMRNNEDMHPH